MAKTIYELLARCRKEGDCLVFSGARHRQGYGWVWDKRNQKRKYAHRLAWELANGPIPDGMSICHHCDNPPCCNPAHLWIGPHLENMGDRNTKGRNAWGIHHPRTKLTENQVLEIYSSGDHPSILARRFNVKSCTITAIKNGNHWSRLTGHKKPET